VNIRSGGQYIDVDIDDVTQQIITGTIEANTWVTFSTLPLANSLR
jgi:hypothetical protein